MMAEGLAMTLIIHSLGSEKVEISLCGSTPGCCPNRRRRSGTDMDGQGFAGLTLDEESDSPLSTRATAPVTEGPSGPENEHNAR